MEDLAVGADVALDGAARGRRTGRRPRIAEGLRDRLRCGSPVRATAICSAGGRGPRLSGAVAA